MKKLITTKKISTGSVLRVYKKGFGYSILNVIDSNNYYLATVSDKDFFDNVHIGDTLEFYLWVENIASYEFSTKLLGKIDDEQKILFFKHTENLTRNTFRKCLRATVDLPLKFFPLNKGDEEKNISTENIEYFYGKILEMDDHEFIIFSDNFILKEKDNSKIIKIYFSLNEIKLSLVGKISLLDKKNQKYSFSIINLSEKNQNKILDYIFSIYRE